MKQRDQKLQLAAMDVRQLQAEVFSLERQLAEYRLAMAMSRTNNVAGYRHLRRRLARALTLARQKLSND